MRRAASRSGCEMNGEWMSDASRLVSSPVFLPSKNAISCSMSRAEESARSRATTRSPATEKSARSAGRTPRPARPRNHQQLQRHPVEQSDALLGGGIHDGADLLREHQARGAADDQEDGAEDEAPDLRPRQAQDAPERGDGQGGLRGGLVDGEAGILARL